MAGNGLRKEVRRRLYDFAGNVARGVSDSRRQRFILQMIVGLVIGGHVHLTKIARAIGSGVNSVHTDEKRLSRHLDSQHWSMQPVMDGLLNDSAAMVGEESLIAADLTDIAKYYARHLEGLGRVRDASDPEKRTAPGYMLFEAYVRVCRWQLFPLLIEPLRTYSGAPTSENAEILAHFGRIHEATGHQGTWVLDRGFDRRELMVPMLRMEMAWIVRQRGDRYIVTLGGRRLLVDDRAAEIFQQKRPARWPAGDWTYVETVRLPEAPDQELLLVLSWRNAEAAPLMLLVSPQARKAGRNGTWFVRAFRRRWGVEDATWGIKQRFHLEEFLVQSWRSIRRLIYLVAIAFYWLNLWGQDRFTSLRNAFINHPWRLPKKVTYLFDWLATQISRFLHPKPKILPTGYFDTG
jgi:hypothetical protein